MPAKKGGATRKTGRAAPRPGRRGRKDPDALTPKEQRFIEEYPVDWNGTAAAIRAGYSAKSAKDTAYELIHETPRVMKALDAAKAKLAAKAEITAEAVLQELARIGFANAGDFFEWGPDGITVKPQADLTREQMAAVAEVSESKSQTGGSIKVKLHDKIGALTKLGQNLGLFVEKHEHSGPGGGPIVYADLSDDQLDQRLVALGLGRHGGG